LAQYGTLQEAGLTTSEALQAATLEPARAFNMSDRGSIAPGMRADMLLLQTSPLEDLNTLLTPTGIWKNGFRVN